MTYNKTAQNIGRNDPCPCLSGKKYKKCCEQKNEKLSQSSPKIIPVIFTTKSISEEDKGYDRPSKEDKDAIARIYNRLRYHPETIESEEDEYFQTLYKLREKYVNFPPLWNYILMGYNTLRLNDKVRETIFEAYRQFPKYLFAMSSVANVFLKEGKPEKVSEIFGGAKSLPEIYPERTVFHVTEGRAFHHTIAYYYCVKGELALAENQLKTLQMVSEMMELEDDSLVEHIEVEMLKLAGKIK